MEDPDQTASEKKQSDMALCRISTSLWQATVNNQNIFS